MALFGIFKKRKPGLPLPQLCYDIAYFILPHYAHEDFGKLDGMCRETPNAAGPYFYVLACRMHGIEPDMEIGKTFHWHVGSLNDSIDYLTLAYPTPPPIDVANLSAEAMINVEAPLVLAPYFSSVLSDRRDTRHYYILGQSPSGGTTLRSVTPDGRNCNLGPAAAPTIEEFHATLVSTAWGE